MELKGKATAGVLIYNQDRTGLRLVDSPSSRDKKILDKPVVSCRWLEDENGKKQLIFQEITYFLASQKHELKPNQEKIADLPDGRMVVQYVDMQASYKDDVKDGPDIRFDKNGNADAVFHFRDGKLDGMQVARKYDGTWDYNLYKEGKLMRTHNELLKEWAEKREAYKFEKLVKSAGIKGLKATLEAGTKLPTTPKGKER